MKKNIIKIIVLTLFLKIVYFSFALIVSELNTGYHIEFNKTEFISLFKRNDSYWYQTAAEQGYPKITNPLDLGYSYGKYYKQSVWAHFPFYPLSIRFVEKVSDLNFAYSAFILSIIFSISSFIAFYLLSINVFKINTNESFVYTMFFMFFPFHYYYSMYYTEAVFFAFLAFSFVFISKKKYLINSIFLIPLTLVRPNGIVCLLPLFIYFIEVEGGFKIFYFDVKALNWKKIRNSLYFLSGPIALGLYCIYQKHMTDYYFAFVKAQSGWYKEFMFPLLGLFRRSDVTTQFNSVYTIIFMIISIIAWKKFSLSQNIFIWISILLPLTSGSAASMPRYISVIFPITIYLTSFLISIKWKYPILLGVLSLQLLTFFPWLISHPFSF
jgi:Gpi18-like mannosyltransferase